MSGSRTHGPAAALRLTDRSPPSLTPNTQHRASPTAKRIASPPVIGSIGGCAAGLFGPTRALLLGPKAPLAPLTSALRTLGAAYLPAVILVLAGTLARQPAQAAEAKGEVSLGKKVGLLMVLRFLFMPVVGAGLLAGGTRAGFIPRDPLLRFILLMATSMPSAQNSVVILQLEPGKEAKDGATSMARTISLMYILAVAPIAALLTASLQFVGI